MAAPLIANLFELVTLPPSGPAESLLLADAPLRPFAATDAARPNARVLNRVTELPSLGQDIYADPTRMIGDVGAGSLIASNADGALSYLAGHSWASLTWRQGIAGQAFGDYALIGQFRPQRPQPRVTDKDPAILTIPFYDLRLDLGDEVQANTMAGDAVGNAGLGGAADLKGQPLPLALGDLSTANVTPPLANQARQIWRLADPAAGAIGTLYNVYYRGGASGLTDLGDLGSGLEVAALTGAQRARDNTRCLLRMGGNVSGEITVDLMGPAAAGATAPDLIKWLLQRRYGAGVALGPGFSAGLSSAPAGLYITDSGVTYTDLIDRLCRSAGLWCVPDEAGTWQLGRYDAPGAPIATIGVNDVCGIEADDVPAICSAVAVKWGRNYTRLARGSIAESLYGSAREAWLAQELRVATYPDAATTAAVKARYINAAKVEVETDLRQEADGVALAQRLYAMLSLRGDGTPRQGWRVAVPMAKWRGHRLGVTLRLSWPAEGLDDPMVLMGRRLCSPDGHLMWLRLWG